MLLFNQGYCYIQSLHFNYELQKDFVQNSRQRSSDPLHASKRRGIPSGHSLVKQHPFERRELSVRTPFYVQKLATVLGCILPNAILDKASRVEDVQPSGLQSTLFGCSVLIMEIACIKSANVRMLGQHRPDAALFKKEF
jgi:hypothetical protein